MNNEMVKSTTYVPITISSYSLGAKISFRDRVRCAVEAGFDGIGLRAENYKNAINEGLTDKDMLNILDEYNMKVTEVEYLLQWGTEKDRTEEQKQNEQLIYHMAHLFNVKQINCGLLEKLSEEQIIIALGELCDRAGDLIVGLEFMPYSGVPDLATAWRVVKLCGRKNAMLILDSWHWSRAKQTTEMIKNVPPNKIVSVHLSDVQKTSYPQEKLRDESLHYRLAPGEGYGDNVGFMHMLKEHGISPIVIGVEVMSDCLISKGWPVSSEIVFNATKRVLNKAWPELYSQR